jgi:opacity protein-like surface antigen
MMYRRLAGIAVALLAVAGSASAQDEGPVSVNVGGGFTIPYSDLKDAFGTGGNFGIGVNFRVSPMLIVQAQYGYNRLGSKDLSPSAGTLPQGVVTSIPLTANHTMHDGDFNLLIGPPLKDRAAAPYGLVGAGVYHRTVNITTPALGLATVCDPWLLICYPTPVAVDQIVGERSSNDFGFNVGGGVSVRVTDSTKFYAEIRYIHTYGPSFTDGTGVSRSANGNYFPFTFGLRFHSGT